uniref:Uncharacterized protein n=1 Tax=Setaria italica TaxID=4555 RepID=K3YVI9_SETIT
MLDWRWYLNQCAAARARSIGLAWAEPARVLGGERDSSGCGSYRCEFSGRGDREIGRRGRGRAGAEAGDGGLIRVKSCGAATGEGLPDEARLLLPFRGRSASPPPAPRLLPVSIRRSPSASLPADPNPSNGVHAPRGASIPRGPAPQEFAAAAARFLLSLVGVPNPEGAVAHGGREDLAADERLRVAAARGTGPPRRWRVTPLRISVAPPSIPRTYSVASLPRSA